MRESSFIETENYIKILECVNRVMGLPFSSHKIVLIYGKYGLGKTIGFERIAAQKNAVFLRALATWRQRPFLLELCMELGLDTTGGASALFLRVVEELRRDPRPIIIDEIDELLVGSKRDVLEVVRDIHDKVQSVAIFLVGMQSANAKLKRHEHYYDRIIEKIELKQTAAADIKKFCELSDVKIEPDLVAYLAQKYPRLRKLKSLIINLEKLTKLNNLNSCDLETFLDLGVEDVGN